VTMKIIKILQNKVEKL